METTSAALQMRMVLSGSGHCQINQKTVIVITSIRKSQWCVLHVRGIKHKTCFFIKLNCLAPKDDNNHCGIAMLRTWHNQHIDLKRDILKLLSHFRTELLPVHGKNVHTTRWSSHGGTNFFHTVGVFPPTFRKLTNLWHSTKLQHRGILPVRGRPPHNIQWEENRHRVTPLPL